MIALVLAFLLSGGIKPPPPRFVSAAVSSGPAEIALGDSFGRVWVVDLECEEAKPAFETQDSIASLQWSRDGRRLIAGPLREPQPGDFDRGVEFVSTLASWTVWVRGRGVLNQVRERMPARSISWSANADLSLLLTYGSSEVARVRDVTSGDVVSEVKCAQRARFTCATWLTDDATLVAGASDGRLYTWNRDAGSRAIELVPAERFPRAIDAARDGVHVLVGFQERDDTPPGPNSNRPVRAAWVNLDTGAIVQTFDAVTGCVGLSTDDGVWDVDIDPRDERCVVTTGSWGSISCFRIADGAVLWREDLGGGNPVRLRAHFSPSGTRIATHGMRMREPTIHEAASGERLLAPYGQFGWETRDGVLWTHDERYLITPDHDLRVADGKTGQRRFDVRCGTKGAVIVR